MEGITPEAATVSYLFLSGGEICKATDLAAFLPRWLSEVNENRPIPPDILELLAHLLLPFGTRDILKHIAKLRIPDSLADVQKWMVKLQVLVDNKAHERLLQKLESIPDQMISFEDICGQSNAARTNDDLVAEPRHNLQFDHDIRDVMVRGDKDEMRQYQDVFYGTGSVAWTVRSPYWNIALATDDEGIRLLPDNVLDRVLPKWRQILTGETIPTPKYGVIDSFRAWLASEEKKASDLGKPWPKTPVIPVSSAPKPKFVSPKTPDRSRLRVMHSSRFSPFESSPNAPKNEQTELLRDILTELKDLKKMVSQNIGRKQEREIAGNQPYGSWQQSYYPFLPCLKECNQIISCRNEVHSSVLNIYLPFFTRSGNAETPSTKARLPCPTRDLVQLLIPKPAHDQGRGDIHLRFDVGVFDPNHYRES